MKAHNQVERPILVLNQKPRCPRCKSNVNLIKKIDGWFCFFCGIKFQKTGQQQLI